MTVPTPTHWQVMLREIRQDKGWSMRELAEKAGMHERTIFEYENVRKPREMSIYKVERILASLGYEMDFFMKDRADRVIKKRHPEVYEATTGV